MTTVLGIVIAFLLMGYIGGKIARRPGLPFSHGFWLCGFLSLIGLLVLLSLGRLDAKEYRGGGAKGQKPCPECHEWIDPNLATCPHCQANFQFVTK